MMASAAREFEMGTLAGVSERLAHVSGESSHAARRWHLLFHKGICGSGRGATPLSSSREGCSVERLGHMSNMAHSFSAVDFKLICCHLNSCHTHTL